MWNEPSKERLANIPRLYETEHIPLKEKLVYIHFFLGGSDWFGCEFDGQRFFGFVILNSDFDMAEWGYFDFEELKSIKLNGWLEVDCEKEEFWKVRKAFEIENIRKACGWAEDSKPSAQAVNSAN